MKNRITPPSRWPLDPQKRIERATRDLDFAAAMSQIMGQCDELDELARDSCRKVLDAQQRIE